MATVQVNLYDSIVNLETRNSYAFSEWPSDSETKTAFWSNRKSDYYKTHREAGFAFCDAYGRKQFNAEYNDDVISIINSNFPHLKRV